jgi:hypothetical protein
MIKDHEKIKDDGNNLFQSHEAEFFDDSLSLKQRLWAFKYKGNIIISIILLSIGAIALLLSYLFSLTLATFIGLGLVLFGVIAFNILPSRYLPEEFTYTLLLSSLKSISSILPERLDDTRVIFFYSKSVNNSAQGYVFISSDGSMSIPTDEQIAKSHSFCDDPKGIYFMAPSQGLVDILEKEAGRDFGTIDIAHMEQIVQKLLVEELKVVDELLIDDINGNAVFAKVVGASCARMCKSVTDNTCPGNQFGCPICASLALIISKVTSRPVIITETNVIQNTIKTTFQTLDL